MDAAPLFLLLLLPPADTTGDTAAGIQASLRRELGDVAMAVAPSTLVTPAMWQGEKAQLRARFVAKVEWTTKDKANVELLASPSSHSSVRVLAFAPLDGKLERGRAIGLVLAELLRESPAAAFTAAVPAAGAAKANAAPPARLAIGAMVTTERATSGNWATGPELTYGYGLSPAFCLHASGFALFGSSDSYLDIGFGLGARWDFLRSPDGRRALGIGLGAEFLHESAGSSSDEHRSVSQWNLALGGRLAGRVTLWRMLRLVGEFDMQAVTRATSHNVGDDWDRRTYSYSRWRPGFALGLELGM
jgi:hypothetical protein